MRNLCLTRDHVNDRKYYKTWPLVHGEWPKGASTSRGDFAIARPATQLPRGERVLLPNHFSTHNGFQNGHVGYVDSRNGTNVVAQQNHVGQLAHRDRAFLVFLKFGVRRTHGVSLNRLSNRQLLLREPAVWILAVEGRASN